MPQRMARTHASVLNLLRGTDTDGRGRRGIRQLMAGIIDFRERTLPRYVQRFRKLASHQEPTALFVACSDSRVVPTLLTSTRPGDLFVVRNVGNLIPPAATDGSSTADMSEAGAIEYAVLVLKVGDIIVCGHSECGAMKALVAHGRPDTPNLNGWLQHAETAANPLEHRALIDGALKPHDQASQLNVLVQLEHLISYEVVRERVSAGTLRLHGWWFDIASGSMYAYDRSLGRFELIDRRMVRRMLKRRLATAPEAVH